MLGVLAWACASQQSTPPLEAAASLTSSSASPSAATGSGTAADAALAEALGRDLVAACPTAEPPAVASGVAPGVSHSDVGARQRCADALTALATLRDRSSDPVLWGARKPGTSLDPSQSRTTQMNARVLRRMYLSTFAFGPDYRVEPTASGLVLHVATRFRYDLDPGDYPYPFWHAPEKWQSYERSREMSFFIERGSVVAVLRSDEQDPERPHRERAWDGQWRWQSERGDEPRNALYTSLFSAGNPHVPALELAYRAFEQAQRASRCLSCHDPANAAKASSLELFSYPNQALAGRHDIVRELRANEMPPASAGTPPGIADEAQRRELLGLAERFAAAGDEALRFEGERVPATIPD